MLQFEQQIKGPVSPSIPPRASVISWSMVLSVGASRRLNSPGVGAYWLTSGDSDWLSTAGDVRVIACVQTDHGAEVTQFLERRTQDPKDRGSNPVRSTRTTLIFSRVNKVVLARCRCVCAQPPVCIRAHKNEHVRTLKIM